jgi:hypothetical protein
LNYSTPGIGTKGHFAVELLKLRAGGIDDATRLESRPNKVEKLPQTGMPTPPILESENARR